MVGGASAVAPTEEAGAVFSLYHYEPSLALAASFTVLFGASTATHLWQVVRKRTWFFLPFVVGGCFEAAGFAARGISARETYPNYTLMPYLIQSVLLLLGPTLYAASIYMVMGRLIRLLEASSHAPIRAQLLTKCFLLGDILSFVSQSAGGGLLASATDQSQRDLGNNIIIVGLGIQIIFFGFFLVVACLFHSRIRRWPTPRSNSLTVPWERSINVIYVVGMLIMARSIFRVAEYVMGSDGELQKKEIYLYALDATLMALVSIIYNIYHPGNVIRRSKNDSQAQPYSEECSMSHVLLKG